MAGLTGLTKRDRRFRRCCILSILPILSILSILSLVFVLMIPISFYNRRTGQLENEVVYEQAVMEFLYGTRFGFWLTEAVLKHRWVTELYARRMHSPRSKAKIKPFIERYGINTDEMLRSVESFTCFNEFFIRQLKAAARPIDREPSHLIAPADSFVSLVLSGSPRPLPGTEGWY